jgi:hypothetical protein
MSRGSARGTAMLSTSMRRTCFGGPSFWQADKSVAKMRISDALHIRRKAQKNRRIVNTADLSFSRLTHKLRFIEGLTRPWYCGTFIETAFFHDRNPNKRLHWSEHNAPGWTVRSAGSAHTDRRGFVTAAPQKGRLLSTAYTVASKAAIAVVALLVSFAASEVFLRTLHPCPRYGYELVSAQRVLFEHDPVLGWRGRPGIHATLAGEDFRVSATHNASGHRSATLPSVPGKTNIITIGDSHSWGWGVSDDEVFTDQMMRMDGTLNVYNISAPGYGTDQEFLALREFLRRQPSHSPELVILLFSANDFEDVGDSMRFAFPKPRFSLRGGRLELRNVPVPDLGRHADNRKTHIVQYPRRRRNLFHTYNLIEWGVKNIPSFKHKAEMRKVDWAKLRIGERNVQVVTTLLCAAKHLCSGVGSHLLVVFLLTGEDWRYEIVRDELRRVGIRFIHHRLRRFPFRNQLWLDGHLNSRGHRQLAKQLVSYVSVAGT